jgi:putative sugar O-methyltransferase
MSEVSEDPALLATMLTDAAESGPLWRPAAYWQGYCQRIERELKRAGLSNLRINQALLKGFALGGAPRPTLPRAAWKRAVWRGLERMPGTATVVAEYRRLLAASHGRAVNAEVDHARLALDRLAAALPQLTPPEGLANGGAEDSFFWRGHTVTADWVRQLARLADFYRAVPRNEIKAIVEIGPGLGLSTLAHVTLNPALRLVINCDIPPVLYVSTQFLKSVPSVEVVDYREAASGDALVPRGPDRPTLYQLAPWQLPAAEFEVDAFFNAFSFQEMERDICRSYAAVVSPRVSHYVLLHSSVAGHKPGAGGQRQPVTMAFLKQTFSARFPNTIGLGGLWAELYGEDPATMVLLSRAARDKPVSREPGAIQRQQEC